MRRTKVPVIMNAVAKRHGLVLMEEADLERQVAVTSAVLDCAFVMYDALEGITKLDNRAAPNAAALIARRAKKEVDERAIGPEEES